MKPMKNSQLHLMHGYETPQAELIRVRTENNFLASDQAKTNLEDLSWFTDDEVEL